MRIETKLEKNTYNAGETRPLQPQLYLLYHRLNVLWIRLKAYRLSCPVLAQSNYRLKMKYTLIVYRLTIRT